MVWTADTESSYKYLAISTPMFLGFAMSGMSQTGGDIPGFLAEPTDDLC
jgi:alpha-glucosidase (family GH31 glycosyl hydrolase)